MPHITHRVVITLEASCPPTGAVQTEAVGCEMPGAGAQPVAGERFTGWMELLAALSAAVDAQGAGDGSGGEGTL